MNQRRPLSKLPLCLIVALLGLVMSTGQLQAHLVLAKPKARTNDNDLIQGPCGGKPKGAPSAEYETGSMVDVTIDLNVRHVDTLQVVISYDNFQHSAVLATLPTQAAGFHSTTIRIPNHTVGNAVLQATDGRYVSCADINITGTAVFPINAGLTDAWFVPDTDGQGFFIVVYPALKQIFLAWFTYDSERPPGDLQAILGEPGHRWMTALGSYVDNRAGLDLVVTSGGLFNDPQKPVMNSEPGEIGNLQLEFINCSEAVVRYSLPDQGLENELMLQRIVSDRVSLCESLQLESK